MTRQTIARDWRNLVLEPGGRSLIEASAGTGKTWTIAVLYLRLLLEQGLTPRQIVVATFTDAAAQELHERIRARLLDAHAQVAALLEGEPAVRPDSNLDSDHDPAAESDPWSTWLRGQCSSRDGVLDPQRASKASLRLRLALSELDIAPIGTLHAVCQRILREAPFDSGSGFVADTLVSGDDLVTELADDAWRRLVQAATPADADMQVWVDAGRGKLRNAMKAALQPGVQVIVPEPLQRAAFAMLESRLRDLLADRARFKPRAKVLQRGLVALLDYLALADADAPPAEAMLTDLAAEPDKHVKPEHLDDADIVAVLDDVADFVECARAAAFAPRARALARIVDIARRERDERLRARGQLSFDGLIERTHDALQAQPALADALHARWPVALVDEFQDTDALQYAVLDRIHRDGDGAPRGRLVMIGDPKQAIYGFRGGDIHAYLHAAGQVPECGRIRLDVNRRSSRAYVAACNEWFARAGMALSSQAPPQRHAIEYLPIQASARLEATPYRIDGGGVDRPLALHYLANGPDAAPARRNKALEACADHIVELLSGRHAIGEHLLQPGDIAVLLPKNQDIVCLRELLQARRVPSVGAARSSVFDSPWARDVEVQLHAAANPHDAGLVRAALATRLGGVDYDGLRALAEPAGDAAWQVQLQRYHALQLDWRQRGVLAVVQAITDAAGPRLFVGSSSGLGERALTDLRQLGELLQAHESTGIGHQQLLTWLAQQRDGDGEDGQDAAKERQLRIESDARRVQLMTLHSAKGLEFPVVILPLMWACDAGKPRDEFVLLHDAATGGRALRFEQRARDAAQWEQQDERYRVLYVALTRARHACHVYALPPGRGGKAGSDKALSDPQRAPLDAQLERAMAASLGDRGAGQQCCGEHVACHEAWPPWAGKLALAARADCPRVALPEPTPLAVQARRHSFSTLTGGQHLPLQEASPANDEQPVDADVSRDDAPPAPPHPQLQALERWKGMAFGNALHAVLEERGFDLPLRSQAGLVARALRDSGLRMPTQGHEQRQLVETVAERLQDVLEAELLPGLRLADVPASHWRAEMAFDYELRDVQVAALREACLAHGQPGLLPWLSARRLHGLMTGKIDLVFQHAGRFHVLDWKGNWLGDRVQDYAPNQLVAAMDQHQYRLQALLYTVAVDRYLRQRLPGYRRADHLGDTLYVFLRAAGLAPGAGVWAHRFDDALVDAIDRVLGAGGEAT